MTSTLSADTVGRLLGSFAPHVARAKVDKSALTLILTPTTWDALLHGLREQEVLFYRVNDHLDVAAPIWRIRWTSPESPV